jgi:flagellar basal body P-ring formation protein FlgA
MRRGILLWLMGLTLAAAASHAAEQARHDPAELRLAVQSFLRERTLGMPGEIVVEVGAVESRLNLPLCGVLEPFIPSGARIVGKVTVGVRCAAPAPWTVYVPATVRIMTEVVVAVRPLAAGHIVSRSDLALQRADLSQWPGRVLTDPGDAIGKAVASGFMAGQPLRQELLRSPPAVTVGQSVRVVSRGPGFEVRTEGKALTSAASGESAQVRVASGQVGNGIARPGAVVEVGF